MINAFDNDTRCIDANIKLYLHGDNEEPININKENYLVSFDLLEELSGDIDAILGSLSSNEFEFEIYNDNDIFTPTNIDSPYYGLLETNVKVEVEVREELSETDWVKLGTFYVYDWNCNQGSASAIITCNDRIHRLIELPTPTYMVEQNISVKDFLSGLFKASGLMVDEYEIDDILGSQYINYAYPLNGTFGDTLKEITKSHMCYIYVNRNNVVRVRSLRSLGEVVTTWTDNNQILSSRVVTTLQKENSGVKITYCNKSITDDISLISLTEQIIPPGTTNFPNIVIKDGPLYKSAHCLTESAKLTYISGIKYTPWDISLEVTNTYTSSQVINIDLYGSVISTDAKSYVSGYDDILLKRVGDKPLEIEGEYIDSEEHANLLKSALLRYISNPTPTFELSIRGNPEVKIGDVVLVNDNSNKINKNIIVLRQHFKFNDALECTVTCMDKSIMEGVF